MPEPRPNGATDRFRVLEAREGMMEREIERFEKRARPTYQLAAMLGGAGIVLVAIVAYFLGVETKGSTAPLRADVAAVQLVQAAQTATEKETHEELREIHSDIRALMGHWNVPHEEAAKVQPQPLQSTF